MKSRKPRTPRASIPCCAPATCNGCASIRTRCEKPTPTTAPAKRGAALRLLSGVDDDPATTSRRHGLHLPLARHHRARDDPRARSMACTRTSTSRAIDDVWAFHEAFADIVALFQHFTYPEVLRHQITSTRGDLRNGESPRRAWRSSSGRPPARRRALRNDLGKVERQGRMGAAPARSAEALKSAREPHERGSILVAAVFDAFLALYKERVRDLLRISTGGTGVLPPGSIHPDLVAPAGARGGASRRGRAAHLHPRAWTTAAGRHHLRRVPARA